MCEPRGVRALTIEAVVLGRRGFAGLAGLVIAGVFGVYLASYFSLSPQAAVVASSVYTSAIALAAFVAFIESIRIIGVQAVLGTIFVSLAFYLLISGVFGSLLLDVIEVLVEAPRFFQPLETAAAYWPATIAAGVYMFGYAFVLLFAIIIYGNARELGVELPHPGSLAALTSIPLAVLAFSVSVAVAGSPELPRKPISVTYTAIVAMEFAVLAMIAPLLPARYEAGMIEDILRHVVCSVALLILAGYLTLIANIVPLGDYYTVKAAGAALEALSYSLMLRAGFTASALARAVSVS